MPLPMTAPAGTDQVGSASRAGRCLLASSGEIVTTALNDLDQAATFPGSLVEMLKPSRRRLERCRLRPVLRADPGEYLSQDKRLVLAQETADPEGDR